MLQPVWLRHLFHFVLPSLNPPLSQDFLRRTIAVVSGTGGHSRHPSPEDPSGDSQVESQPFWGQDIQTRGFCPGEAFSSDYSHDGQEGTEPNQCVMSCSERRKCFVKAACERLCFQRFQRSVEGFRNSVVGRDAGRLICHLIESGLVPFLLIARDKTQTHLAKAWRRLRRWKWPQEVCGFHA